MVNKKCIANKWHTVLQTNTKGAPLTPFCAVGAPYGISKGKVNEFFCKERNSSNHSFLITSAGLRRQARSS